MRRLSGRSPRARRRRRGAPRAVLRSGAAPPSGGAKCRVPSARRSPAGASATITRRFNIRAGNQEHEQSDHRGEQVRDRHGHGGFCRPERGDHRAGSYGCRRVRRAVVDGRPVLIRYRFSGVERSFVGPERQTRGGARRTYAWPLYHLAPQVERGHRHQSEREPDVDRADVQASEAGGRDTDDGVSLFVQLHRATNHGRVATELQPPEPIADDRDGRRALDVLFVGAERTPRESARRARSSPPRSTTRQPWTPRRKAKPLPVSAVSIGRSLCSILRLGNSGYPMSPRLWMPSPASVSVMYSRRRLDASVIPAGGRMRTRSMIENIAPLTPSPSAGVIADHEL